jgi:ABC-type lipoprotein release transport system permease subunit
MNFRSVVARPARNVFTDETTELVSSKAAANTIDYRISADYFHAAGTSLLQGRDISLQDDRNSPAVAVVAVALLGSVATWIPAQRALAVNPLVLLRED